MPKKRIKMPPIEFLGYSLLKCDYFRDFDCDYAKKVFIIADAVEKIIDNIYKLSIKIEITFKNGSVSKFEYLSQFKINNEEWFDEANKEQNNVKVTNLFSLAFPYIRSSISAITNDSLGIIVLPVIDVLECDVTKGVTFLSSRKKS